MAKTRPPQITLLTKLYRDGRVKEMGASGYMVYGALLSYVDWETGDHCFPSIDTLCKETGLARSTVTIAIKHLESIGEVIVERGPKIKTKNPDITLRHKPNQYKLPAITEYWENVRQKYK